eukprot:CAMPEP_0172019636 /NCGR_PEP_ID=MMETSP1041-20130122/12753_1 /TAXON_ID=464988 /ORGANISM="Hemiselmis andersenii, Strain CCMP439" /LENGTH=72 /DNA_ID=CAMNT_0012674845 /DNA_START=47 /DNA_END=265 /DNA_ORIENTATION=+
MPLNRGPVILASELAFAGIVRGQHVVLQRSQEQWSLLKLKLPGPKERVRPHTLVTHKPEQVAPKPTLFYELE